MDSDAIVAITLTSMSAPSGTRVLRRWAALRLSTRKSAQPQPHNAGTPAVSDRTAVFALGLGNAVQWYDFALYGAFATVIGRLFFPAQNPSTAMLAAFPTYGIALVVRPVGALCSDHWRIFMAAGQRSC